MNRHDFTKTVFNRIKISRMKYLKFSLVNLFVLLSITGFAQININGEWMYPEKGYSTNYTDPSGKVWQTMEITGSNSSYKIPLPGNQPLTFSFVEENVYKSMMDYYMRIIDNNHIEIIFSRDNRRTMIRKGIVFYDEVGDFNKAISIAKEDLDKDKKNPDLLNSLAWYQLKNKEFNSALTNLEQAMKLLEEKPNSYTESYVKGNLAHAYLFTNNYDKAIDIYTNNLDVKFGETPWLFVVIDDFRTFLKLGITDPNLIKAIETLTEEYSYKSGNKKLGFTFDKRDNVIYQTVKIGNQIWFAQNLYYKHTNSITVGEQWESMIGRHYTYSAAIECCPTGWYLPSDNEWKILEKELGMPEKDIDILGFQPRGEDQEIGKNLIESSDIMFYAKYAGVGSQRDKSFSAINKNGQYWTSSKADEVNGIMRVFSDEFKSIVRDKTGIGNYLSVRCVKDASVNSLLEDNETLKNLTGKIEANPTAGNYYNRSIEFLSVGEYNYALEDINKAIELNKTNNDYLLFKSEILYNYSYLNNQTEIKQLVQKYLSVEQNNSFAWFFDARLKVFEPNEQGLNFTKDNEKLNNALISINKAIEKEPNNPEFLKLKSKIYYAQGDMKNAVASMEKELSIDNTNPDLNALLAITKLKHYDSENRKNNVNAGDWCIFTGQCYKLTQTQINEVCGHFKTARQYGTSIDITPYEQICSDLRAAELYEQYKPKVYTGPRGGRYMINSKGNKVYLPRNQ